MKFKSMKNRVALGNTTLALMSVLPAVMKRDAETLTVLAQFDSLEDFERRLRWPLLLAWLPGRYTEVVASRTKANSQELKVAKPVRVVDCQPVKLEVGSKAGGKRDVCTCCKRERKVKHLSVLAGRVVCTDHIK